MCADLVMGLNLQKKRGNHADSFLSADISLQKLNTLKKGPCSKFVILIVFNDIFQ